MAILLPLLLILVTGLVLLAFIPRGGGRVRATSQGRATVEDREPGRD